MVEGREVFDADCLRIKQRRRQREAGAASGVLDQPQAERPEADARVFGAQGAQGVRARRDLGPDKSLYLRVELRLPVPRFLRVYWVQCASQSRDRDGTNIRLWYRSS